MEADRLIAWDAELHAVHARLRQSLAIARAAVLEGDGDAAPGAGALRDAAAAASADLLLYCTGFCVALDGHHRSEDAGLFPALVADHPELRPVVGKLVQDHSMLSHLLLQFRGAMESGADRGALERHLEGIAAIMESHFRYEERELLGPLSTLRSAATASELLGPLA
ncbi:hemerythrin domain-containing protein [Micromonospora sp. DT81.3]|uniref:hemerythrin domain-containing protein n=1 Tax=Micromonospora sp. DT81.3 TaxID=3416523 RepID=UPI003CFA769C